MEEFALIERNSGKLVHFWSSEKSPMAFYSLRLAYLPGGEPRILFAESQTPGRTYSSLPAVIWLGDPESQKAEAVWKVDHPVLMDKSLASYDIPTDILLSPDSDKEFIYLYSDELWLVDLASGTESRLGDAEDILAWTADGIVVQSHDIVHLVDRSGTVLREVRAGVSP
jgi:hypothetical protein